MKTWYELNDTSAIDSPALLVYPNRMAGNITTLIEMVNGDTRRLRPHVKTNKSIQACQMMMDAGIDQFKCSTIAEAEMLAMAGAKDVLLAYQPVGPKIQRWTTLILTYPNTSFSCLVDNVIVMETLSKEALKRSMTLSIYFDVDIGMGRTGARISELPKLWSALTNQKGLILQGLHGYDGHIHDADPGIRREQSDASYQLLKGAYQELVSINQTKLLMIIGGSPSFSSHAARGDVICSPGTFIFWDWGYAQKIPEQDFDYAAVLLSRVISIIDSNHICVDLGYKAVASDPPAERVMFLNAPMAKTAFQSEEHLVLKVADSNDFPIGKVLYGIPTHVCPTVALYDQVEVIQENQKIGRWQIIGRNRKLTI